MNPLSASQGLLRSLLLLLRAPCVRVCVCVRLHVHICASMRVSTHTSRRIIADRIVVAHFRDDTGRMDRDRLHEGATASWIDPREEPRARMRIRTTIAKTMTKTMMKMSALLRQEAEHSIASSWHKTIRGRARSESGMPASRELGRPVLGNFSRLLEFPLLRSLWWNDTPVPLERTGTLTVINRCCVIC